LKSNKWKDKNVLITGATGFVGSWLTERLIKNSANITVLVKNDPLSHVLDSNKEKINFIYGDVRDEKTVDTAIKNQDVIFHLAGITQILYSVKNPKETFEVNFGGTMNILESVRKNSDAFLVFASTDKVYGEPSYLPLDEKHPLSAKSPYDTSKLAADRLVFTYYKIYGIKTSITRCSNIIGGRDSNILRIVPGTMVSLMHNERPVIRGHGGHMRDYVYVNDAVNGILAVAEKEKITKGEAFNFGTEKMTTTVELVNSIIKLTRHKFKPIILNRSTPGEILKQCVSFRKAKKLLKWEPKTSFKKSIMLGVGWYMKNPSWIDTMKKVSKCYGVDEFSIKERKSVGEN